MLEDFALGADLKCVSDGLGCVHTAWILVDDYVLGKMVSLKGGFGSLKFAKWNMYDFWTYIIKNVMDSDQVKIEYP